MSRERAWFLSPSIATALFFVVQLGASFTADEGTTAISGAGAETPTAIPVTVRVVAEIHPLERPTKAVSAVPTTEAALFELIERDGAVIFDAEEVDVVATPEREFEPAEALVIRARAQLGQ